MDKVIEHWRGFLKKSHIGEKFSSLRPLGGPPRKDGLRERAPAPCEPRPGIGTVRGPERGSQTRGGEGAGLSSERCCLRGGARNGDTRRPGLREMRACVTVTAGLRLRRTLIDPGSGLRTLHCPRSTCPAPSPAWRFLLRDQRQGGAPKETSWVS